MHTHTHTHTHIHTHTHSLTLLTSFARTHAHTHGHARTHTHTHTHTPLQVKVIWPDPFLYTGTRGADGGGRRKAYSSEVVRSGGSCVCVCVWGGGGYVWNRAVGTRRDGRLLAPPPSTLKHTSFILEENNRQPQTRARSWVLLSAAQRKKDHFSENEKTVTLNVHHQNE